MRKIKPEDKKEEEDFNKLNDNNLNEDYNRLNEVYNQLKEGIIN